MSDQIQATNGGGEVTTPESGALQTEQTATQVQGVESNLVKSESPETVGQQATEQVESNGTRADARIRQLLDKVKGYEDQIAGYETEIETLRNPQTNAPQSAEAATVYEQFPALKGMPVQFDENGDPYVTLDGQPMVPVYANRLISLEQRVNAQELSKREDAVRATREATQKTVMDAISATREAAIPGIPQENTARVDQFINMLAAQHIQENNLEFTAENMESAINAGVQHVRNILGSLGSAQAQDNSTAATTQPPPGKGATAIPGDNFSDPKKRQAYARQQAAALMNQGDG